MMTTLAIICSVFMMGACKHITNRQRINHSQAVQTFSFHDDDEKKIICTNQFSVCFHVISSGVYAHIFCIITIKRRLHRSSSLHRCCCCYYYLNSLQPFTIPSDWVSNCQLANRFKKVINVTGK